MITPTIFPIVTFSIFLLPLFCSSLVKSQDQSTVSPSPSNDDVVLTEDDLQKLFKQAQANKRNFSVVKNGLTGRTRRPPRFPLPEDWVNPRHQKPVACGGTYEVANGFVRFILDSHNSPCYLSFIGSRVERCTVGVMCDGVVRLSEGNPPNSCQNNYIKIRDGTTGTNEGCGQLRFLKPTIARNKGTDLYLEYKGSSPQSPCVAFCTEDLQHSKVVVSQPELLAKSSFPGFPPVGSGSCVCGKRNDRGRIVGGTDALKFEFPWLAALVFKGYPSFQRVPFCDGALISDSHILTAAHCFVVTHPAQVQVLLHAHVMDKTPSNGDFTEAEAAITPGWNLPKSTDRSEKSLRLDIEKIIFHPLFSKETFDYDVAILKLKKKVNLHTDKVSPICLPYMGERFSFKDHENMIVAGWGYSGEKAKVSNRLLQKLDVPFVDYPKCLKYMPASKRHLCAGYLEGGKDSCTGDSGGPLIYNFNPSVNQFMLSGVVSSGAGCAQKGALGLYTDVNEIIQWVYHHTTGDESVKWCSR